MKSIGIAVIACSLLALVFTAARAADNAPTTRPSVEEENKALRSQLDVQREQIKKLSKELIDREQELAQLKLRMRLSSSQLPQAQPFSLAPGAPTMPPGSVPHQFNGSTFYLVPLGEGQPQEWIGTVKVNAVGSPESPALNITTSPRGVIDDRSGPTRELIHGK